MLAVLTKPSTRGATQRNRRARVSNRNWEMRCVLVKSLIALGWLRDIVLVLFFCAGNHLRHSFPTMGFTIMAGTLIIFAERFVWSWHLYDLRDKGASDSSPRA